VPGLQPYSRIGAQTPLHSPRGARQFFARGPWLSQSTRTLLATYMIAEVCSEFVMVVWFGRFAVFATVSASRNLHVASRKQTHGHGRSRLILVQEQ
jgi:hypothetical protein